jgi:replication-associated recombination protein RarA
MQTFAERRTVGGYLCGEVASALQKEIRRGNEREALFWATELDLSGFGNYVWKRLRIIGSEDIGLAEPLLPVVIRTLNENWIEQRKAEGGDSTGSAALFLLHAVVLLVRARKSRLIDHALMALYEGERPAPAVPDFALDQHTIAGRKMGRGADHFFDEGARLENEADVGDTWYEEGRAARSKPRKRQPPPTPPAQGRLIE